MIKREATSQHERRTATGHVVGATYRSAYWGGTYRVLFTLCALLLCVGIAAGASGHWLGGGHGEGLGRCFPAGKWGPASDGLRPCVKVTRIYEDGSFSFRVSDADGTERYTSGVGALDR